MMYGVLACATGGMAAAVAAYGIACRRSSRSAASPRSAGRRSAVSIRFAGMLKGRAAGSARARKRRTHEMEGHLPELAETLSMGLRAGLPLDRAFSLYCTRFDDVLAASCARAYGSWTSGLATREEALQKMAAEFDSPMLERLAASISRTARFGGSLARSLDLLAAEARSRRRAEAEERIAKVPVKMMIPTAVLILPAMLIVVMGPVILGAVS